MKRTPVRGVKENLKPSADKRSEGKVEGRRAWSGRGNPDGPGAGLFGGLMACLLKNEPAS